MTTALKRARHHRATSSSRLRRKNQRPAQPQTRWTVHRPIPNREPCGQTMAEPGRKAHKQPNGPPRCTFRIHPKNLGRHDLNTFSTRFGLNIVRLELPRRPLAAQCHSAIRQLNPARERGAENCHRPAGHTPNCHQSIRSVWWPHSDLSHRRAIPYPTGKRHTGIHAALQPDLFRHRSAALPTGASLTEHPPAGDANRIAPQHDQQGVPPTGACLASDAPVGNAALRWRNRSGCRAA